MHVCVRAYVFMRTDFSVDAVRYNLLSCLSLVYDNHGGDNLKQVGTETLFYYKYAIGYVQ